MYEGKSNSPVGEYFLHRRILVFVKDRLPDDISIEACLRKIEKKIPEHLLHELDSIYIGQFKEFAERDINAFYRDGAIFVTNDQSDDSDLIDDIVHEIAHSVEEYHTSKIYGDALLEGEFLGKRQRLYDIMRQHELDVDITRVQKLFFNLKYSLKFDNLLYKQVGYPLLASISVGLFCNPYAITSLREYFASGFEEYYIGDRMHLKRTCPRLYNKINELNEE
jgi:hypothetical protein